KPPKDQRIKFFVSCCNKANRRCYDSHKSKEAERAGFGKTPSKNSTKNKLSAQNKPIESKKSKSIEDSSSEEFSSEEFSYENSDSDD
ncbi:unnamed protein product, partial [Brachionus calyciflorus]